MEKIKNLLSKIPLPIFLALLVLSCWIPAFLILNNNTPGVIDSWVDYVAIFLFILPMVIVLFKQLKGIE